MILAFPKILLSAVCLLSMENRAAAASTFKPHESTSYRNLQEKSSESSTSDLICQIGADLDTTRPVSRIQFDFWYAVGSNVPVVDAVQMNLVEKRLFYAIRNSILWCYEEGSLDIDDIEDVGARKLSFEQLEAKDRLTEQARRLGIIAINSSPMDIRSERDCPPRVQTLISSTDTPYCNVYRGLMLILAHAGNDLSYTISSIYEALGRVMTENVTLGDLTPNVTFLTYLGDTEEEAFPAFRGAAPNNSRSDSLSIVLATTIPLLIFLLFFAFFRRRQLKTDAAATAASFSEKQYNPEFLVGTGDPPESFHEGLYHFMADGTRYLSTRCEPCYETWRNRLYTANMLGTIPEDASYENTELRSDAFSALSVDTTSEDSTEESVDDSLISPDETDLGTRHSGMDVRNCNSATCNRCSPRDERRPLFLPSSFPPEPLENPPPPRILDL